MGKEATILYTTNFINSVDGFIDDDEKKQGKQIFNKTICSLEEALKGENCFIVLSLIYSYEKISAKLKKNGLVEGKDFVWGPNWLGDDNLPSPYDFRTWESLDQEWDYTIWNKRTGVALEMLDEDVKSILDLGAGGMHAKNYIDKSVKYYPVDYCQRFEETIVCDLNDHQFPDIQVDCILALGILQYVQDADWFIKMICTHCNSVIFSYSTLIEISRNFAGRQRRGDVNNFKIIDIIKMFIINDFIPADERMWENSDFCIKFERKDRFYEKLES